MTENAIVVTTINHPTGAIRDIARNCGKINADFIIIGDDKSPKDFTQSGAVYLDINAQCSTGFKYAVEAPRRHYARKNVGYLLAIERGADVIIETDDDNFPLGDFWKPRKRVVKAAPVEGEGWVNIYSYFSQTDIWPRGLPLEEVLRPQLPLGEPVDLFCPIQQGLADDNPDVDAIYRLVRPLPLKFAKRAPITLVKSWCPFNSQNTTFFKEAFPLLYLPYYCSFRMTDIWRSFIAQRIAFANEWGILFHHATVYQERNVHNLLQDFADEVPGYLHNNVIRRILCELDIDKGADNIADALRKCYQALIRNDLIDGREMNLLDCWLYDLSKFKI